MSIITRNGLIVKYTGYKNSCKILCNMPIEKNSPMCYNLSEKRSDMAKVYLEDYNQHYRREVVARLPSPRRCIPIIRYAIERYMTKDVSSIDAVYIEVAYVSNVFYCGSKYALRYKFHSAEEGTYIRVQYPDVGVYFKDHRNYGVDDFFCSSCNRCSMSGI